MIKTFTKPCIDIGIVNRKLFELKIINNVNCLSTAKKHGNIF